jgi:hypothetical protein
MMRALPSLKCSADWKVVQAREKGDIGNRTIWNSTCYKVQFLPQEHAFCVRNCCIVYINAES